MSKGRNRQALIDNLYTALVGLALFVAFLVSNRSIASWDFDGGSSAGIMNSIQETLPNYVQKDGTCKSQDLSLVLKGYLRAMAAVQEVEASKAKTDEQKKKTVRKLLDSEKSCLKLALEILASDKTSKDKVPEDGIVAVEAAFGLKNTETKKAK